MSMNQRSNLASVVMYAMLSTPFLPGCQTLRNSIQTEDNRRGYVVVESTQQKGEQDAAGMSIGIDVVRLWDYLHDTRKKSSEPVRTQTSYPLIR